MAVDLFYFSGTGNSLYIARELIKRLPDSRLIPMISHLGSEKLKTGSDKVGFVFPLYFMTIPAPVRTFIEKLDVCSAQYTFSIATRMGTLNVAHRSIERLLNAKGRRLNAVFSVTMANNSPTGLKPFKGDRNWMKKTGSEKIDSFEKKVQFQLALMEKIILTRTEYPIRKVPNPFLGCIERLMNYLIRSNTTQIDFYADESCTGCGICRNVCLSGKVRMENNHPQWDESVKCYYCYSCFNFCPAQSILVQNKYSRKDGRYHHPAVNAEDIAAQKKRTKRS